MIKGGAAQHDLSATITENLICDPVWKNLPKRTETTIEI